MDFGRLGGFCVWVAFSMTTMICSLSDEELWSGIDRQAPEVEQHLATCSACRERAGHLRAGIGALAHAATPPVQPLPERIGAYRIIRRLGEGGMGIVYEGEQETPKRLVAIKVVRGGPLADEYRVRLFRREAQTLARLRHPAIGAIYEAGCTDNGQHFFAMELVRGTPLNEYVRKEKTRRRVRLELFRSVCSAIHYAHQRGVIHRDVKPTNIIVDADGKPKILDFGLARITDDDGGATTMTSAGRLMGTLPYMSPEESKGSTDDIDVRSDVYSLGVVLYELMTDQLPYTVRRAALPEAVRTICEDAPRRPSALDRSLRGDLETICLKALEKERGRRYQSAAELAEDVERFLSDQPILARRASVFYRLSKFVVRHRLFFFFALASVAVVTIGRLLVDREMEQGHRASQANVFDLQDLEVAVIENKLAEALDAASKPDEAEPHYRNALTTFLRLDRAERIGPTAWALAVLILDREDPPPSDAAYEDAESFLLEALDAFSADPKGTWPRQRDILMRLQFLYGPDVWNEQELLSDINDRLEFVEAVIEGRNRPRTQPMR